MLMQAATQEMLEAWKTAWNEYKHRLHPNRKSGAEILAYLSDNYSLTELHHKRALRVVSENVLRNKPMAEKLPAGSAPEPVAFLVQNSGKGKLLFENQDEVFKGSTIFVGIDLTTGYFCVEGSSMLWDELYAFRGLDEKDLQNPYCVAEYRPQAEVIGIDFSPSMIEKAKKDCAGASFRVCDAGGDLSALGTFDLIFANASLQWMPDHAKLLKKYFSILREGGAMAMQIPQFERMPISRSMDETASSPEFASFFGQFESGMHYYPSGFYYDVLSALTSELYVWTTDYYHIMSSHEAIIEMIRSTGLKPYLERLPKESQGGFTAAVLEKVRTDYPLQKDGKVLFPFKRFFFVAYHRS